MAAKKRARARKQATRSASPHRWSAEVTSGSDALDLERSIFTSGSAVRIAHSLKQSAQHSHRRKGTSYQSAMSMLNFYINRAGENLTQRRRAVLERAKQELRKAFDR